MVECTEGQGAVQRHVTGGNDDPTAKAPVQGSKPLDPAPRLAPAGALTEALAPVPALARRAASVVGIPKISRYTDFRGLTPPPYFRELRTF